MYLGCCYNPPLDLLLTTFSGNMAFDLTWHACSSEEKILPIRNSEKLAEGAASFCEFNAAEPSGREYGILLINGLNCQATLSSQWASQLH